MDMDEKPRFVCKDLVRLNDKYRQCMIDESVQYAQKKERIKRQEEKMAKLRAKTKGKKSLMGKLKGKRGKGKKGGLLDGEDDEEPEKRKS